jgi:hypothetical protein
MLDNEDFVVEQVKKVQLYKDAVDRLVSLRKQAGAAAGHRETDSDSDMAHEDDDDVEDDTVAAQHHRDTNAAQQSVPIKRSKVDPSNVLEGKRDRKPTTAPRAAVYANRSELAFQGNPVHPIVCGMRISLRKGWCKTPDEVALDKKLEALIHAIELMYTWDQRVFAEAERVRREAEMWWRTSPHAYDDPVWVTFSLEKFLAHIVHESAHGYVVKMPPFGDHNMPIELRSKIEAACPGKIGPFDSRNEAEPIQDCLKIRKSDTRWTVSPFVESVEEPAVTEEECPPESDEGSEEGSEVPSETEAEDSQDSQDEDAEDEDAEDEDAEDGDAEDGDAEDSDEEESDDDVPLSVKKADQEAVRRLLAKRKANRLKAQARLPSGSGNKAK